MSTRYAEPFYFDHGTQFFTARDPSFQRFIEPLVANGLIAPWTGKVITLEADRPPTDRLWFEPHYIAVPNMNSLCKSMAEHLAVMTTIEVAPLPEQSCDGWHVTDKSGAALGIFDWVISTAPPAQTVKLFGPHLPTDQPLREARLLGCYTLMIGFNAPWEKSWIGAKMLNSPLEWVAINSTKPCRNKNVTSIVAHTSNAWAEEHIDDGMEKAELFLRQEFERVTKIDTSSADYFTCHRWRYAMVDASASREPFMDASLGLASAGDWCSASRIEDTWLNALQLADRIKQAV
jgi:predicted NAD/FAD-dependent oxidoreductase